MNNKMKKLAAAVLAVAGLSGCTSMQVADLAPQAEETKVSRPLPGYDYLGGYRIRRFAAMPAAE